jgi:hypothetical protein
MSLQIKSSNLSSITQLVFAAETRYRPTYGEAASKFLSTSFD